MPGSGGFGAAEACEETSVKAAAREEASVADVIAVLVVMVSFPRLDCTRGAGLPVSIGGPGPAHVRFFGRAFGVVTGHPRFLITKA